MADVGIPDLSWLHEAFVNGVRKASNVPDDWRYCCFWLRNDDLDAVKALAEKDKARIISYGSRRDRPGVSHATFFLSSEAIEVLKTA